MSVPARIKLGLKNSNNEISASAPLSRIEKAVLLLGLVIPLFAFARPGLELISLAGPLSFIAVALVRVQRNAPSRARGASGKDYLAPAVMIFISFAGQIAGIYHSDAYAYSFAWLFLFTCLALSGLASRVKLSSILEVFAFSGVVAVILIVPPSIVQMLAALRGATDDIGVAFRYSPFGMHPNLVGHVFGSYSIVTFWVGWATKAILRKVLYGGTAVLCLIMCLASSSRGGLFAALAALGGSLVINYSGNSKRLIQFVSISAILVVFLASVSQGLRDHIATILQLNSQYRGVNSGLTGRVENWYATLVQFGQDPIDLAFGSGFRSAQKGALGYSLDSGYLTILIEQGIPGFLLIIALTAMASFFNLFKARMMLPANAAVLGILIYFAAESVVARYTLSFGNPASLLFLYILMSYGLTRDRR